MASGLNQQHIVEALTAIHLPGATPEQIAVATQYLTQCEGDPQLPIALLQVHLHSPCPLTRTTSLLLLVNVVRRNWHLKPHTRGQNSCAYSEEQKAAVRQAVVEAYGAHHMQYHKHYNQLLRALAKRDYPASYPQLHQLMAHQMQGVLAMVSRGELPGELLRVLATVKAVMKEFNAKKMAHNEDSFNSYVSQLVGLSSQLAPLLHARTAHETPASLPLLLECLRKADKITLYGLGTMPTKLQYSKEVGGLLRGVIERVAAVEGVVSAWGEQAQSEGVKYVAMVLEQVARVQNAYPFLLADYLRDYLLLLLRLMLQQLPQSPCLRGERVCCAVVGAGFKPLVSFAYYMTEEEFRGSIYCRKQPNSQDNLPLQQHCHLQFRAVFSPEGVEEVLRGVLTRVMTAGHVLEAQRQIGDELVFEDVEVVVGDSVTDPTPYEMCVTYLKHFLKCFKPTALPWFRSALGEVLASQLDSPLKLQILRNMVEVLLMLPHLCDEEELPLDLLQATLSLLHQQGEHLMLARLARKYFDHMSGDVLRGCLTLMGSIVSAPPETVAPHVLYQAALTLKSMLRSMEGELPPEIVVPCLTNLVGLVPLPHFARNPNLLWPIINLLIKLVRLVDQSSPALAQQVGRVLTQGLHSLIRAPRNEELTIGALAELLSTLVFTSLAGVKNKFKPRGQALEEGVATGEGFAVSQACYCLVRANLDNPALENYDTVMRLWLTAMRSYPTLHQQQAYQWPLEQLNQLWLELYSSRREDLLQQDPLLFVEITEEYYIAELLPLTAGDVAALAEQTLSVDAGEARMRRVMALTSLTLSFWATTQALPETVPLLLRELVALSDTVSQSANAVRTELLLLFDGLLLDQPAQQVCSYFTQQWGGDLLGWFLPFLKSMRYVCHKFAFKLNSAALLKLGKELGSEQFAQLLMQEREGETGLEGVLRVIAVELGPSRLDFLPNSYDHIARTLLKTELYPEFTANHFRKTTLHLAHERIAEVARSDLTEALREVLLPVLQLAGWDNSVLYQRLGTSTGKSLCLALAWPQVVPQ